MPRLVWCKCQLQSLPAKSGLATIKVPSPKWPGAALLTSRGCSQDRAERLDRLTGSISAQKTTLQINGLCIIYAFVLFPWQPPEASLAGGSSPFYREQEWVWHQEGLWPQGLLTWGSVNVKQQWVGTGKGGSYNCQNPARLRLGRGAWGVEKVGGLPSHPATCCCEWHAGDGNGVDSLQERKGCLSPPLPAFLSCWLSFLPSLLAWELNIKALKSVSLHWNLRALPLKANVWMLGGTWSTVKSEGDLGRLGWLRRMCQHAPQWVCPCVCRAVCMPVWVCVWTHGCEGLAGGEVGCI